MLSTTRGNPLIDNLTSRELSQLSTRWRQRLDFWEQLARGEELLGFPESARQFREMRMEIEHLATRSYDTW